MTCLRLVAARPSFLGRVLVLRKAPRHRLWRKDASPHIAVCSLQIGIPQSLEKSDVASSKSSAIFLA
jgi:hypothetical protein